MRHLFALVAALAAVLATLLVLTPPGSDASTPDPTRQADSSARSEGVTSITHVPRSPVTEAAARRVPSPAVEAVAWRERTVPRGEVCIVTGTVVDGTGGPLGGALVKLEPMGFWQQPVAGDGSAARPAVAFERETRSDGTFRFDLPVPDAEEARLLVRFDRLHREGSLHFGSDPSAHGPMFTEGVHDVGEIVLHGAGAIVGTVRGEDGRGIEGVLAMVRGESARTDADGRFSIEHVRPGHHTVRASADGYQRAEVGPVECSPGVESGPVDLVLRESPKIRGRVLDAAGDPIAGARVSPVPVTGWSTRDGATSDAEGRFELELRSAVRHWLQVEREGFVPSRDRARLYAPGADGVEVRLTASTGVRVVVVADESGEELSTFGVLIRPGWRRGRRGGPTRPPRFEDHGGPALIDANPDTDGITVAAPGRLVRTVPLVLDAPGEPTVTVRLQRAASLLGRVLEDGAPVVGAAVGTSRIDEHGYEDETTHRRSETDDEGRFRIDELDAGSFRLVVSKPGSTALVLDDVEVDPPQERDLGDLEIPRAGGIAGTIVAPAGVELEGLGIVCTRRPFTDRVEADGEGRFRFDDLGPGPYDLYVGGIPHLTDAKTVRGVEVSSGRTTEVRIDLTTRALVEVEITLDLGGLSTEGCSVMFEAIEGPHPLSGADLLEYRQSVRVTGDDGVARGFVRALGRSRVLVRGRKSWGQWHPTARVDLRPGETVRATITFDLASARLRLPRSAALPANGDLIISFETDSGERSGLRLPVRDGALLPSDRCALSGRTLEVHGLMPGEGRLTIRAQAEDGPTESVELHDGTTAERPLDVWSHSCRCTLDADRTTDAALR